MVVENNEDSTYSHIIESLKHALHIKMVKELKEKADKGESAAKDVMTALILAAIIKGKSKED